MFSPALRHRQRVLAHLSGTATADAQAPAELTADTAIGQEYAGLRVLLYDNLRSLSDVASHEARIPLKIEMARAFAPWIDGVLLAGETGAAAQDEIVTTNLVWAIDYRDFDYALRLAGHAIRHGLAMPERFKRTPACYLTEEVATIANAEQDAVTLEHLIAVQQLVEGHDFHDAVRAKLHKAIGRGFARKADAFDPAADNAPAGGKAAYVAEALEHLQRAFQLDRNVGVKKDIERLERAAKGLADEPPQN